MDDLRGNRSVAREGKMQQQQARLVERDLRTACGRFTQQSQVVGEIAALPRGNYVRGIGRVNGFDLL